ncbi:MAG TPA: hypothetical protein VF581_11940 [Flavobacterium sp.]|jgi:hypothetical protein
MAQHDETGNTDPQRGARDADPMHSGDKSILKNLSGLSDALSNDENGFSNKEGFNKTDDGSENLAGSGGSQTSDMFSLDNEQDFNEDTDRGTIGSDQFEDNPAFGQGSDEGGDNNNIEQSGSQGGMGRGQDQRNRNEES